MEHLGAVGVECSKAAEQLSDNLAAAGLHVIRSFDLQSARQALRDPDGCPCPHHGTPDCTCQYIVLLVETGDRPPITLVAHGHDGTTNLSADGLAAADPAAAEFVRANIAKLTEHAPAEA